MGDVQWSEKMNKHDQIMKNTVESFNGKLVKNTGDGILAALMALQDLLKVQFLVWRS